RQDGVELFGNLADGVRRQIGRRIEWRGGLAACVEGSDFAHGCHLGGWGWGNGASPAAPGAASSRRNVAGNLSFHVGRRGRERKASSLRIAPARHRRLPAPPVPEETSPGTYRSHVGRRGRERKASSLRPHSFSDSHKTY